MAILRSLVSTARMLRHTPRLSAGLVPDDAVLLDAPDARLAPALVGAGRGEHRQAAELLAATREGAEWENRDRYVRRLAGFAYNRSDWLDRWRAAAPNDPDALLVGAQLAVRRAWESPARAELLREVAPLIDAAAGGDPLDPVPWRLALDRARGIRSRPGEFEALWAEAVRRSPHHYGCHVAALKYLASDRPHGGRRSAFRESFDFAEHAAEEALPASMLRSLPLLAAFVALRAGAPAAGRVDTAADLAIGLSAQFPVSDPWPAEARNLLVYVLVRRDRWTEALEQLRRIGLYATSFPWSRMSADPLGQFLELRDGVRVRVASATPLRDRTGRRASDGHYA
ncbi:hypothetical protein [Streptomyces sp. GC420]|uniref:hypothetical protein n=1 Tax=Streptomyces sp. GC420 TaxID=2697568 RepID=UPI0014152B10|nr:hypothetical protein [Streptomyces sp. GC420]NBM16286.1 hypothetical protein [Streptomyces sp. GC420]